MSNELNAFFAKVSADEDLQKQLYATKELADVASIAREMGFKINGRDILRAQAGRVLMLPPDELEIVASGERAKTGAQWGRGGKGYLDNAGFWVYQFLLWGYDDSAFEPQLEGFLAQVKSDAILKNELLAASTHRDVANVGLKAGYAFTGSVALRYQALQILKISDEEAEKVASGAI